METDINKLAKSQYLMNPDMIRFLLAENLALKMILNAKGLLTPEEFEAAKNSADQILAQKMDRHIEGWKQAHPEMVNLFEESVKTAQRAAVGPGPSPHAQAKSPTGRADA